MSPMNLHDLQQAFSNEIFKAGGESILPCVKGSSDEGKKKRLNIYRNNVFYSLSNALGDLYPVIRRLVGEQFFMATAAEYIRQSPPRSAAMVNFGGDFPGFLTVFEHTEGLLYLADVAEVELARHHAYHAEDVSALSVADFSAVNPERLGKSQLVLHPSVTLLKSRYPAFRIWNANQDENGTEEIIDLDSGGVTMAVLRPEYDVYLHELDLRAYTLLDALREQEALEMAIYKAAEADSTSLIPEVFAWCIQQGFFTEIVGS